MIAIKGFKPLGWFHIQGMVIYPFVIYSSRHPGDIVENHEGIHFQQIKRDGVYRFYTNYFFEYFRGRFGGLSHHEAYMNISYEREAYLHQRNLKYTISQLS